MKFLLVLSFVAFASCSPVTHDDSVMRLVLSNVMNCINSDFGMCLKVRHVLDMLVTEQIRDNKLLRATNIWNCVCCNQLLIPIVFLLKWFYL